jgi:hypothetical protein
MKPSGRGAGEGQATDARMKDKSEGVFYSITCLHTSYDRVTP